MKKHITIILIVVSEIIAVIGALPLIPRYSFVSRDIVGYKSFWEHSEIALPAFLALVTAGIVFYTRNESKIIRIATPIALVGALILTIELVKAFA